MSEKLCRHVFYFLTFSAALRKRKNSFKKYLQTQLILFPSSLLMAINFLLLFLFPNFFLLLVSKFQLFFLLRFFFFSFNPLRKHLNESFRTGGCKFIKVFHLGRDHKKFFYSSFGVKSLQQFSSISKSFSKLKAISEFFSSLFCGKSFFFLPYRQ
jgi:hypothetical protein